MRKKIATAGFIVYVIITFGVSAQAKYSLVISTFADDPFSAHAEAVLQEAYKKADLSLEIVKTSGERAIQLSNSGETDGELYRIKGINSKYTHLVMVPVPVCHSEIVVFTKSKEFVIKGWKSLKPYKIGMLRGAKYAEKNTKGMNRFMATKTEQLYYMLDQDRLDIVVNSVITGLGELEKTGIRGIRILKPPLEKHAVFHYLHKKNKALVPRLESVLREMEKAGRIRKIQEEATKALKERVFIPE